jgi:hypothetical protein
MDLQSPFEHRDGQIAIDLPGAHALFTTRSWGDVRQTHGQIADGLGVALAMPKQVHGAGVARLEKRPATAGLASDADAVVTGLHGVAPTVVAADCLPIVIASPGAVATVHAGWRGLAGGVIANAVAALRELGGGVLTAAIGPGAGVCCYEVGEDLHRRFRARGQDFRHGTELDLKAIARVQLMETGVARIFDTGICTICGDPQLTYSYRREGPETGRHAAIAWLS